MTDSLWEDIRLIVTPCSTWQGKVEQEVPLLGIVNLGALLVGIFVLGVENPSDEGGPSGKTQPVLKFIMPFIDVGLVAGKI